MHLRTRGIVQLQPAPQLLPAPALVLGAHRPRRRTKVSRKAKAIKYVGVELDRSVVEPGDVLTGRVRVDLADAFKFKNLSVTLRGVSKVHWTDKRCKKKEDREICDEIEYLDERK